MHIGRYRVGDFVPLGCECVDSSGTPSFPTAVPTAKIFDASSLGGAVETVNMPVHDRFGQTGFFRKQHRLSSSYSAAKTYIVIYNWAIAGTTYGYEQQFETVAGGDADGNVIGAIGLDRPEGQVVVYQLDGGKLHARRGPR